jgi:hypothetical protein
MNFKISGKSSQASDEFAEPVFTKPETLGVLLARVGVK